MTASHHRPWTSPLWVRHGEYQPLLLDASTSVAGTGIAAVTLRVLAVSLLRLTPDDRSARGSDLETLAGSSDYPPGPGCTGGHHDR